MINSAEIPNNSEVASLDPKSIQDAVTAYLYFYGNRQEDPTRELSKIASNELHQIERYLDANNLLMTVGSCDDPDDPLIIFHPAADRYSPEITRVLAPNETFTGYFSICSDHHGPSLRVYSDKKYGDRKLNSEFAILMAGTYGPEFKIVSTEKLDHLDTPTIK